jgi:hypothetical protein
MLENRLNLRFANVKEFNLEEEKSYINNYREIRG